MANHGVYFRHFPFLSLSRFFVNVLGAIVYALQIQYKLTNLFVHAAMSKNLKGFMHQRGLTLIHKLKNRKGKAYKMVICISLLVF